MIDSSPSRGHTPRYVALPFRLLELIRNGTLGSNDLLVLTLLYLLAKHEGDIGIVHTCSTSLATAFFLKAATVQDVLKRLQDAGAIVRMKNIRPSGDNPVAIHGYLRFLDGRWQLLDGAATALKGSPVYRDGPDKQAGDSIERGSDGRRTGGKETPDTTPDPSPDTTLDPTPDGTPDITPRNKNQEPRSTTPRPPEDAQGGASASQAGPDPAEAPSHPDRAASAAGVGEVTAHFAAESKRRRRIPADGDVTGACQRVLCVAGGDFAVAKAAITAFFESEEKWVAERGWDLTAFAQRIEGCVVRAVQADEERKRRVAATSPTAAEPPSEPALSPEESQREADDLVRRLAEMKRAP